jgi:hypothetical protein
MIPRVRFDLFERSGLIILYLRRVDLLLDNEFEFALSYLTDLKNLYEYIFMEIKNYNDFRTIDLRHYKRFFLVHEKDPIIDDISIHDPLYPLIIHMKNIRIICKRLDKSPMKEYFANRVRSPDDKNYFFLNLMINSRLTFIKDVKKSLCTSFSLKKKHSNDRTDVLEMTKNRLDHIYVQEVKEQQKHFLFENNTFIQRLKVFTKMRESFKVFYDFNYISCSNFSHDNPEINTNNDLSAYIENSDNNNRV